MAKIDNYRAIVKRVLSTYTKEGVETETQAIFDEKFDHYLIVQVGWRREWYRDYGTLLHIDIKNDKIWIQQDGTEIGIATLFMEEGVPKSDIVLGFHAPYKRQFTEFAVG